MSKNNVEPFSLLNLGAPGLGKSWFAATIADYVEGKTLLMTCKPREKRSVGYVKRRDKIDTETYFDFGWRPYLEKPLFEADAFLRMYSRLHELYSDDIYDAIIIDPYTDFVKSVENEISKHAGVAGIGDMDDPRGAWKQLGDKLYHATMEMANLCDPEAVKRPKFVIVVIHTQPPKEDQYDKATKTTKPSADKVARGIEYEGTVLPMIDGAYRRKIVGEFDIAVYSELGKKVDKTAKPPKQVPWYSIQISPDHAKHSKIAIAELPVEQKIDNDFGKLLEALKIGTG